MDSNKTYPLPKCFSRSIHISAPTDGLLRRVSRLAREAHSWTQDDLLFSLLTKERRRLHSVLRKRGEDPMQLERADYSPDNPMPELPAPDASPIDDVGPRE